MRTRVMGQVGIGVALVIGLCFCGGSDGGDGDARGDAGAGGEAGSSGGFGNGVIVDDTDGSAKAVCGDGQLNAVNNQEACDDRNTKAGDGCSATCQVEPGWVCPVVGIRCQAAKCGDGIVAGNERCDDGNDKNSDGCDSKCQLETGFACDVPGAACRATVCNDGKKEGTEACDDGNNDTGDRCSPFCQVEPACPPGGGACQSTCGDGLHFTGDPEECEDGNTIDGDGCSKDCKIEAGFTCTFSAGAEPAKLALPLVLRDFKAGWNVTSGAQTAEPGGHADFQRNAFGLDLGIPDATLGMDGKPAYAKASGVTSTTSGKALFDQWYRDVAGVNTTVLQTMTLDRLSSGVYQFDDGTFFSLDGIGFGNQGLSNNFHFTSEVRYWFEYKGGENLTFRGDDDVWVFVNKKLVIDLGGVHGAQNGSVTLNGGNAAITQDGVTGTKNVTLGLEVGKVYEAVVFQAERHTTESSYKLTLSGFVSSKSTCQSVCGDGIVTPDEVCDDGPGKNTGGYGKCNADCKSRGPFCGDGIVQGESGETCDDGNSQNGDGCQADCRQSSIR